jgi:hypothetical protein
MTYRIREVDASDEEVAEQIHIFNRESSPRFPELKEYELEGVNCYWWFAYYGEDPVGFCGMVPSRLYQNTGYLKRAAVPIIKHRGNGLQRRFLRVRETKARCLGWQCLITETLIDNIYSSNNLIRSGYVLFEPKERWANESIFWKKQL